MSLAGLGWYILVNDTKQQMRARIVKYIYIYITSNQIFKREGLTGPQFLEQGCLKRGSLERKKKEEGGGVGVDSPIHTIIHMYVYIIYMIYICIYIIYIISIIY